MNKYTKVLDEILNKKFSKNLTSGYDPLEVDMFFDRICTFIIQIYQDNNDLNKKINEKTAEINELKKQISSNQERIKLLNHEIQSYVNDGYENQKMIKDISAIMQDIDFLKKSKKQ